MNLRAAIDFLGPKLQLLAGVLVVLLGYLRHAQQKCDCLKQGRFNWVSRDGIHYGDPSNWDSGADLFVDRVPGSVAAQLFELAFFLFEVFFWAAFFGFLAVFVVTFFFFGWMGALS